RHHQSIWSQTQPAHLFKNFPAHVLIHPAIDKQAVPLVSDHPDIRASLNDPDIFLKLDQLHGCFPFFLDILSEGKMYRETAHTQRSAQRPATRQPSGRLYQKGKYVAFFSASVYYSLNFQQLVVVHTQEETPLGGRRKSEHEGNLYIMGEKCVAKLLRLDVAQLTDVGRKRDHNEDNMAYVIPKDPQVMAYKGALFIVADGMGGHAAGEVASEIAVDTVSNAYYQDDNDDVRASLLQAIR